MLVKKLEGLRCTAKEGSPYYLIPDYILNNELVVKFSATPVDAKPTGEFTLVSVDNHSMLDNCLLATIENDDHVFVVDLDNLMDVG